MTFKCQARMDSSRTKFIVDSAQMPTKVVILKERNEKGMVIQILFKTLGIRSIWWQSSQRRKINISCSGSSNMRLNMERKTLLLISQLMLSIWLSEILIQMRSFLLWGSQRTTINRGAFNCTKTNWKVDSLALDSTSNPKINLKQFTTSSRKCVQVSICTSTILWSTSAMRTISTISRSFWERESRKMERRGDTRISRLISSTNRI